MLNSKTLREALQTIFGIEDKYLVQLDEGWYVPTYDPADKVGTWIGYRILSKKPNVRTFTRDTGDGVAKTRAIRVVFRMSFIGPQSEDLADQTLLWDDRSDVQDAFAQATAQLNYSDRQIFSYPVKNGGLNDSLCWCVDISAQTFYETKVKWNKWNLQDGGSTSTINIDS